MEKKGAVSLFLVAIVLVAVAAILLNVEIDRAITPEEQTYTAIGETAYRIDMYMAKHGAAPKSLSELPRREGYSNSLMDGWNNELTYTIASDGTLTISSLGKDRKTGGVAENSDISVTYQIREDKGGLILGEN